MLRVKFWFIFRVRTVFEEFEIDRKYLGLLGKLLIFDRACLISLGILLNLL